MVNKQTGQKHMADEVGPTYPSQYETEVLLKDGSRIPADDLQLGPLLQHLGGVEVPQLVRGERPDACPQARPLQGLLDVVYLGIPRLGLAREKEGRVARIHLRVPGQHVPRRFQQRDDPPFVPLADDIQFALVEVYVLLAYAHALREPPPRGHKDYDDRPYLVGVPGPGVPYLQHPLDISSTGAPPLALAVALPYVLDPARSFTQTNNVQNLLYQLPFILSSDIV